MATTIWLLRQRDPLGAAGRFYKVTDELGADYVAKGWAQRLDGSDGELRRPDQLEADQLEQLEQLETAEAAAPAAPGKRGPGRPRKAL